MMEEDNTNENTKENVKENEKYVIEWELKQGLLNKTKKGLVKTRLTESGDSEVIIYNSLESAELSLTVVENESPCNIKFRIVPYKEQSKYSKNGR